MAESGYGGPGDEEGAGGAEDGAAVLDRPADAFEAVARADDSGPVSPDPHPR